MPHSRSRAAAALILAAACSLPVLCLPALAQRPPAVLDEIIIEGNTRTGQDIVERIIGLSRGDPFDIKTMDWAWNRLEDCGYFAFVDLSTEQEDGRVTLLVTLEEEKTARYSPYVRYSPRHRYLLGGTLRDMNLRGRGEILDLQAVFYRIQRGHAAWTKPWFLDRNGLSFSLDSVWEQGPFVWRPFDYAQWHLRAMLRQRLVGPFYLETGGGFESFRQKNDYTWPLPDRGEGAIGTGAYPATARDGWIVCGTLGFDTRDNPFYPRKGMFHEAGFARRTGGGRDVTHYNASLRFYIDLGALPLLSDRPILALHARGHAVDGPAPVEHGLFWGGAETVRGAPYARREGEHGYLLSAELRWPLFLLPVAVTGEVVGFGLHAFFDAADAWFDGTDPGRALQGLGVGVHLNLLTWQFRFEAARERDHGWSFQFMDTFNF